MCKIKMCVDRVLTGKLKTKAIELALAENPANGGRKNKLAVASAALASRPSPHKMAMAFAKGKMAVEAGKKWQNGRTLRVCFLDGSQLQIEKCIAVARQWSGVANINFEISPSQAQSDIRISFNDEGSWSYIGTDALAIDKAAPTMNFGWLDAASPQQEWNRVVLHEFGHALGAIHEHQNPEGGIQWNVAAVKQYFKGPPNNWTDADIETNVLGKYSADQINASVFDPQSIMLYDFDGALILGGKGTRSNSALSAQDRAFMAKMYPR